MTLSPLALPNRHGMPYSDEPMTADREAITADKPCLPPYSRAQYPNLDKLLRDVSRSFYLTLRVLPRKIRPQISLAYLLARASDTIADTQLVPRSQRLVALRELQPLQDPPQLGAICDNQPDRAERVLLERLPHCLDRLKTFSPGDRERIETLLRTIIGGQMFDLEWFPAETPAAVVALRNDAELDHYTYLVAGCVGEFWTRMCHAHLPELRPWNLHGMESLGVRFGKGLQLVNILRDMPKDLRIGRCYLPVQDPGRLLDPQNYATFRDQYQHWLDVALQHLDAGWNYTMHIPPTLSRLRLACVWPIWIGLMTIARLRQENPLDPAKRIKITRSEVYGVMFRSWWHRRNDAALERHFQQLVANAQSLK